MRLHALSRTQKSLLLTVTVATSLGIAALPASASVATPEPSTLQVAPTLQAPRTVDHNAAYFVAAARGTAQAAHGKVDTKALDAQISLLSDTRGMASPLVLSATDTLRDLTATTAADLARHDRAEAARKKAAAEKAAKAKAAREAAARQAAEARAAQRAAAEKKAAARPAHGPSTASLPARPAHTASVGTSAGAAQAYARSYMASTYGWGADQFSCTVSLFNRESGWNYRAANGSGAYGIPQALPGSKMASAGADWATNPATQVRWGLSYIKGTYGTPCAAWAHSNSAGWY